MCHKKITIFACNCVLRNHRLCPHSQNLVAVTPDNTMQGNSQTNPQDNMNVSDQNHINNANTASEGDSNKDDVNTASQNNSTAPTITLEVSTPPPSPDGTATPLNAGASPFAPTSSPFAPMSSPLASTSSVGATIGSSTIRSPLSVDTPSASIPTSPSTSLFFTPTPAAGPSPAGASSGNHPSLGTIFTSNPRTDSSLSLPFFGHSSSAPAGSNINIAEGYPFPSPTNGTLTPSTWMFTHLSYARQQQFNPNPQHLIISTLAETRSPATRDPLPSGFYPRHFESAQRHIHWKDCKTEWIDCAGFYCTHFRDLPTMTKEEKEKEHHDCPENFGDADELVLQLGLCKECEGYHYEAASRGEGGSMMVEWGRAMVLGVGVGGGGGMGLGQGQGQGQSQTRNQPGPEMGGQHQQQREDDGQTTLSVEARYIVADRLRLLGRERRERRAQTHQSHNQQPGMGGQHATEDDGQTTPTVESRYSVADQLWPRGRVYVSMGQGQTHQSHNQPPEMLVGEQQQQQHEDDDDDGGGYIIDRLSFSGDEDDSYMTPQQSRSVVSRVFGHTHTHNQPEMLMRGQQQPERASGLRRRMMMMIDRRR